MTVNPQLILAPDVEGLLIVDLTAWLLTQGWDVPVSDELAAGERTESVAVYRVGGTMDGMTIDNPTIAVETKGGTKTRSFALINLARAWFHGLAGFEVGDGTYGVVYVHEFSGPGLLPLPDSPTRYTMTLTVGVTTGIL